MAEDQDDPSRQELVPREGEQSRASSVSPEFQALLDLEHDRIRIADRRTALLERVLAAAAAQDQREFEDRKITYAAWRDRFKFLRFITFVSIGGVAVVIAVLLWALLWGTERQAETAFEVLKYLFVAVGGAGVAALFKTAFRHLMRDGNGE